MCIYSRVVVHAYKTNSIHCQDTITKPKLLALSSWWAWHHWLNVDPIYPQWRFLHTTQTTTNYKRVISRPHHCLHYTACVTKWLDILGKAGDCSVPSISNCKRFLARPKQSPLPPIEQVPLKPDPHHIPPVIDLHQQSQKDGVNETLQLFMSTHLAPLSCLMQPALILGATVAERPNLEPLKLLLWVKDCLHVKKKNPINILAQLITV